MVVWIAWWACVDVLFHVLFHTRPPMVVSDVCQCVFHTQITTKQCVVQFLHHPSTYTLPFTNNTMPFCMPHKPVHHASSTTVISSECRLLHRHRSSDNRVCDCDGMHHSFAPIINTLSVPTWCHPVWPSLCFGDLVVVSVVHHVIVLHTPHILAADVVE